MIYAYGCVQVPNCTTQGVEAEWVELFEKMSSCSKTGLVLSNQPYLRKFCYDPFMRVLHLRQHNLPENKCWHCFIHLSVGQLYGSFISALKKRYLKNSRTTYTTFLTSEDTID